jgi:MFS family permease
VGVTTERSAAPPTGPPPRLVVHRLLPEDRAQRALALAVFVNTFGSGMIMTSSALYFTQVVGLPVGRYALGLLVGSLVGLLLGLWAGRAADRFGAREAQIVVMLAGAAGMVCYVFVTAFWQFVLVSVLMGSVYAATTSSQGPLIRVLGAQDPVGLRAYLRSVTNLAIALGTLAAGGAIAVGSRDAYLSIFIGRALAFLGCAWLMLRVPRVPPMAAPKLAGRWQALRDRPYVLASVVNSLMSIHFAIPTVLLPLWIAEDTRAPRWMVSGVFLLSTGIIVCLQVRVSRGVEDPSAAGIRMRWAGIAIAAGLAVIAMSAGCGAWSAAAILLAGTAVYTIGELWHAAASMEYSFGLAAPQAQGQYSGVFGLGSGAAQAIAPTVVGVLALHWAGRGLIGLGLCFAVVGAVSGPIVNLAVGRWPQTTAK